MDVAAFEDIAIEFERRVRRIIWCNVVTVDGKGRPRSRILHPVWEGSTGWIGTSRQSLKANHLANNPYVSLSYWDTRHQQVYVDCRAEWVDDRDGRRRAWGYIRSLPEPYGYDPKLFWSDGPDGGTFGALKLTPWRIELCSLEDLIRGTPPKVWRSAS
jgi:general stress protein 26